MDVTAAAAGNILCDESSSGMLSSNLRLLRSTGRRLDEEEAETEEATLPNVPAAYEEEEEWFDCICEVLPMLWSLSCANGTGLV